MNLKDLILSFSHQSQEPFALQGHFGLIQVCPELNKTMTTYRVICNYKSINLLWLVLQTTANQRVSIIHRLLSGGLYNIW